MITCLKHKVNYEHGKCPVCVREIKGVAISYSSNTPEHISEYNLNNSLEKLKELTEELKRINNKINAVRDAYYGKH